MHATKHAQHPSLWRVTDAAERERARPAFDALRARVIASIERQLAELDAVFDDDDDMVVAPELADVPDTVAATKPQSSPAAVNTVAHPPLPHFAPLIASAVVERPRKPTAKRARMRKSRGDEPAERLAAWFGDDDDDDDSDGGDDGDSDGEEGEVKGSDDGEIAEPGARGIEPAGVLFEGARTQSQGRSTIFSMPETARSSSGGGSTALSLPSISPQIAARSAAGEEAEIALFDSIGSRSRQTVAVGLFRMLQEGIARDEVSHTVNEAGSALDRHAAVQVAAASTALRPATLRDFARAIEGGIHGACGGDEGVAYFSRARTIMGHLRDPRHTVLRTRLLAGELAPSSLAAADAADLVPPEVAREAAESRARATANVDFTAADRVARWYAIPTLVCTGCGVKGGCEGRTTAGAGEERDIRKAEIWGTSGGGAAESIFELRCMRCELFWTTTDNVASLLQGGA